MGSLLVEEKIAQADPQKQNTKKKHRGIRDAIISLCKLLFILAHALMIAFVWDSVQEGYEAFSITGITLMLLFWFFFGFLLKTYGGLEVGEGRVMDLLHGQIISTVFSDLAMALVFAVVIHDVPKWIPFLQLVLCQLVWNVLWSICVNALYFAMFPPKKTAIIYDDVRSYESIRELHLHSKRYEVVKTLDWQEFPQDRIFEELTDMDAVFLCGVPEQARYQMMKLSLKTGVKMYIRPSISDVLLNTAERKHMFHVPILACKGTTQALFHSIVKRTMDIVASLLLLILASPFMLITAIAIKCGDKGPVFYRQERLTKGGKTFNIVKFRSMRTDAEKDGVARLAAEGDSRITRVGKVIRATRIDELPQLINILKGDMSLVGPRPERPEIARQYMQTLPEFDLRLQVKAGLTGYAQIYGRYNSTPYEKLQMDLMYIADKSIMLDIKLLLQTVRVLLQKESTEGVAEGKVTADDSAAEKVEMK